MTTLPTVGILLDWVHSGQERLERVAEGLPQEAVAEQSALPGWTRGHVLTHLARNADALVNLLTWARTGVPSPMYGSPEQRNADIEAGAGRDLAEQLADLRAAARRFAAAAADVPADRWSSTVVSGQGRQIPASAVPWLRAREVWIHLVDLDAGVGIDALPADLAWALVRDVSEWMSPKLDDRVMLNAEGYGSTSLGPAGHEVTVAGTPNQLAGWLIGRTGADELRADQTVPQLPRWL